MPTLLTLNLIFVHACACDFCSCLNLTIVACWKRGEGGEIAFSSSENGYGNMTKHRNAWWRLSTLTHHISLRIRSSKSPGVHSWSLYKGFRTFDPQKMWWVKVLRCSYIGETNFAFPRTLYESKWHHRWVPRGSDTSANPRVWLGPIGILCTR